MKTLDLFILLFVLVSSFFFVRISRPDTGVNEIKLFEGEKVFQGREGFIEVEFFNGNPTEIVCNVSIYLDEVLNRTEINRFEKGLTFTNFSILLPFGESGVGLSVDC